MKKHCLLLLLIFFVSNTGFAANNPLSVWLTGHTNEEMAIIRDLTQTLFTSLTGISVSFLNLSWSDFENRFLMAAAVGETPDVGGAGAMFLPELGLRGALIDLSTMSDFKQVKARTYQSFYRSLEYKGLTFGIPYYATASIAFQRDDLLKELGVSTISTWDELKKVLPKMQVKGTNFSFQWFLTESLHFDVNMIMWQIGADDYNADLTKSGYDSRECLLAFKDYTELYTKYKIPKDIPVLQAFSTGELALTIQYLSFYQNLTLAAPQISGKWSMVPAPGYLIKNKLCQTTSGGSPALGIFKLSNKKKEAWQFISWFTEEKTQAELYNRIRKKLASSIFIPANKNAILLSDLDKDLAKIFNTTLENCTCSVYGLVAPKHRRRYLLMAAQKAILNNVEPETAIKEAANEHNEEIRRKQVEYDRYIKKLLNQN